MQKLVLGGSASGKSEFAENLAVSLKEKSSHLVYIATMQPFGSEAKERISRHRALRKQKGFETIECYTDLAEITIPNNATVLLECIGNLLANEMFKHDLNKLDASGLVSNVETNILNGLEKISHKSNHLVIVSNDIFCDGIEYATETQHYQRALAKINRMISSNSSAVIEVVCGIPLFHKGGQIEVD